MCRNACLTTPRNIIVILFTFSLPRRSPPRPSIPLLQCTSSGASPSRAPEAARRYQTGPFQASLSRRHSGRGRTIPVVGHYQDVDRDRDVPPSVCVPGLYRRHAPAQHPDYAPGAACGGMCEAVDDVRLHKEGGHYQDDALSTPAASSSWVALKGVKVDLHIHLLKY